ncbi:PilW family protein [Halomonas sp. HP20-15]|uniref:PilW family protein n=1 Tax=Halomonas sp. HP20-15 TaxID=3085901 RepID=UPI00298211AA|nr:PilW family protein [Halomonas sp. HP20-15]MDW5376193.1 PilW family protein [Halomonas sp. HP20-15]
MMRPALTGAATTGRRQSGVGLVELMISITIGLVLVALVTNYYLSSRQSYQTTVVSSELTDAQRYAMQQIRRQLMLAGYSDSWMHQETVFPTGGGGGEVPPFAAGGIIASNKPGELWLRMQGAALANQPTMACNNQQITKNTNIALIHLFIEDDTLKCETRFGGDPQTSPLLDGVEAVAFSYLDDSDEFKTYNDAVDWPSVRAIQVDLLIRSEAQTYDAPVQQSFQWPGSATKDFTDRYMRSRVTRIVTLRNSAGVAS